MNIILASKSPRRRELLEMLGVRDLKIIPADGDETQPDLPPGDTVCAIALEKARAVANMCKADDVIIGADTLVYLDGEALGKPRDEAEAAAMLRRLSGREHTVFTGVAIIKGSECISQAEATEVFFRDLTAAEIAGYISTGESMDKAGAYAAQGRGAVFIRRIEGDFFNVMGLPLCLLSEMLKSLGVAI